MTHYVVVVTTITCYKIAQFLFWFFLPFSGSFNFKQFFNYARIFHQSRISKFPVFRLIQKCQSTGFENGRLGHENNGMSSQKPTASKLSLDKALEISQSERLLSKWRVRDVSIQCN